MIYIDMMMYMEEFKQLNCFVGVLNKNIIKIKGKIKNDKANKYCEFEQLVIGNHQ